jgi:hypothetical protein
VGSRGGRKQEARLGLLLNPVALQKVNRHVQPRDCLEATTLPVVTCNYSSQ